ncbi:Ppx/GppA family phosphatase [Paenibacillus sp. GSMTC-2017]|uniref:Ppx/GppA phosphatase family protein n=1 Tax=Paenibacillus sp. GSMTC-2017 TaxID=2794350 RepID=UPI0018D68F54|nr:Ppx/GppA phosphatase family protein [Paenibacillus sp. GSMTC-2017]MBH5317232.1 Ppx/GppA family phosphatase [Paenibacillus sp. GSMTC-2017]
MTSQRIGIIDIGSNSIRLVVYERTENGAHRVVDGSKRSARLSSKIDDNGALPGDAINELIDTLKHFIRICSLHAIDRIRAVATAAIRNATNQPYILKKINKETGLSIELLSGKEEAEYGFLGMINSLQVSEGYLIDIGGGSTEVSLFRNRILLQTISLPFGCVSLNQKNDAKEQIDTKNLESIEKLVLGALKQHKWIFHAPNLPLIGVGGTVRALGKVHQALNSYPLAQTHNYNIEGSQVENLFQLMLALPLDQRRKLPGLSKDRADVIVPGVAVLRAIFRATRASHYKICGAGLRDGLFHATRFPNHSKQDNPLTFSLSNLSALHTEAPRQHVKQVNRLAKQLFNELYVHEQIDPAIRVLLDAASQLYRIGASIDYYDYAKHSFYLIIHSHLNGLSHREIVMTAAIASFKSKGRAKELLAPYRSLITIADLDLICKLGVLLQLSAALDRSESQSIRQLAIRITGNHLILLPLHPRGSLAVEIHEVEELASDFKKQWGLSPILKQYEGHT